MYHYRSIRHVRPSRSYFIGGTLRDRDYDATSPHCTWNYHLQIPTAAWVYKVGGIAKI